MNDGDDKVDIDTFRTIFRKLQREVHMADDKIRSDTDKELNNLFNALENIVKRLEALEKAQARKGFWRRLLGG